MLGILQGIHESRSRAIAARKQLAEKRFKDIHFRDLHMRMTIRTDVNVLVESVSINNTELKSTLDT
jgi:hypothetical protein